MILIQYKYGTPAIMIIYVFRFSENDTKTPKVGDCVAAVYDDKWYVGKVMELDSDDDEAFVSFMESSRKSAATFKFPNRLDEIWVSLRSILAIIERRRHVEKPCASTKSV